MSGTDVLMVERGADGVADGVWTLGGQGNSLLVDHGDGLLLVDAGPGHEVTRRMIASVRSVSDKPVTHIVISHGHMGYNFGVSMWQAHARSRGEPEPVLAGHERVVARYRRYRETAGLQSYTNTRQFREPYPAAPPAHWFIEPTLRYDDRLRIDGLRRDIELIHAPSETDDGTAVWLPRTRLLYGACACISSCPNVGSPFRIHRDPLRWADTLDRLRALAPAILVPEFGRPLTGADDIEAALTVPARAIRWLRAEVVERMNRGLSENQILHDIDYPPELFANRFMRPVYGCPDWIVREIWRMENGWWDRNPTTLHPQPAGEVAAEVLRALGDPRPVIDRARALAAEGRLQMALHVIDLVAQAPGDEPAVIAARELKAELLRARADEMTSAVSRHLMLSEAEVLRDEPIGSSTRRPGAGGFSWT